MSCLTVSLGVCALVVDAGGAQRLHGAVAERDDGDAQRRGVGPRLGRLRQRRVCVPKSGGLGVAGQQAGVHCVRIARGTRIRRLERARTGEARATHRLPVSAGGTRAAAAAWGAPRGSSRSWRTTTAGTAAWKTGLRPAAGARGCDTSVNARAAPCRERTRRRKAARVHDVNVRHALCASAAQYTGGLCGTAARHATAPVDTARSRPAAAAPSRPA